MVEFKSNENVNRGEIHVEVTQIYCKISYKNLSLKMKTNYTPYRLKISNNQKEKRKLAIKSNEPGTIIVEDIDDDILALTTTQINKMNKAFENDKRVNIELS